MIKFGPIWIANTKLKRLETELMMWFVDPKRKLISASDIKTVSSLQDLEWVKGFQTHLLKLAVSTEEIQQRAQLTILLYVRAAKKINSKPGVLKIKMVRWWWTQLTRQQVQPIRLA